MDKILGRCKDDNNPPEEIDETDLGADDADYLVKQYQAAFGNNWIIWSE